MTGGVAEGDMPVSLPAAVLAGLSHIAPVAWSKRQKAVIAVVYTD